MGGRGLRVLDVVLLALLAAPVLAALAAAAADAGAWRAWHEAGRFRSLLANTAGLAAIAGLVAVPAGAAVALALARLPLPGRGLCIGLIAAWLFVPLPVLAVAWQVVLATWLPGLAFGQGETAWRPWASGLLPAGIVHGFAAMPWVVMIVLAGLRWSDRTLEEDALLLGGPRLLLRRVLLPRILPAVLMGLAWVIVQTFTEIPITDAMMVRTLAEEVYIQLVSAGGGTASAVAMALPIMLAGIAAALLAGWRLARHWRTNPEPAAGDFILPLGRFGRVFGGGVVYATLGLCCLLPLAALCWKACGGGILAEPSAAFGFQQVKQVLVLNGRVVVQSLAAALLAGWIVSRLALRLAWNARGSPELTALLLAVAVLLALTPGPVLGLGLKTVFFHLMDAEDWLLAVLGLRLDNPPLRSLLYDQPSPVPGILAAVLRFLPVGLAIVLPVMWTLPRDLLELARLDGVSPWRLVGRPHTARAAWLCLIAVAALAVGEVSASKLVTPPGHRTFILELFDQMHYGTEPMVAAMSLLLLGVSGLLAATAILAARHPAARITSSS